MYGRIQSYFSWMKMGFRRKLRDARRMDFQKMGNFGGILCMTGSIWRKMDTSGGFGELSIYVRCMMYFGLTIFGHLRDTMRFLMVMILQEMVDGD